MFSQPFIFHFFPVLLPHLYLNLELIPRIELRLMVLVQNYDKSPLTILVIGQHADDGPLCENDCISNAQQVIIAMEIQWCWTQGLADLS